MCSSCNRLLGDDTGYKSDNWYIWSEVNAGLRDTFPTIVDATTLKFLIIDDP